MKFVTPDRAHLTYRIDGPDDAPTIVMIHSLGTNLRMWDPQVALFGRTLRIIRYDCRGHGSSDRPAGPYTMQQFGLDLLALLDTLHIERAHLCGLSLGGMVAQWCAINYPNRVISVTLANTAAHIGTNETWNARIDAVRRGGMEAIRDAVLARFLSEQYRRNHPEVAQQISTMIVATSPQGYIDACIALRDTDLRNVANTIHVPSLILAGDLDEATPPSQAYELHSAIAGSELVILHNVAHLSNVEQPEQFSSAIVALLRRT